MSDPQFVHVLKCCKPGALLTPWVRAFAERVFRHGSTYTQRATPRLETVLEFQFDARYHLTDSDGRLITTPEAVIVGASTHILDMSLRGSVHSFGIFFRPTGFARLFGVPLQEFTGRHHDADSVLGSRIQALRERLGDSSNFAERVTIAESFLLEYATDDRIRSRTCSIAEAIFSRHGAVPIAEIAQIHGLSARQLERVFQREVGTSPKLYARVARLQTAIDRKLIQPRMSWTNIAHDLGYHDQMHMIHDFQRLVRVGPRQAMRFVGDGRPPAYTDVDSETQLLFG